MFIPITVGTGSVSTEFETVLSGTLYGECSITVNGETTYPPNAGAKMKRGDIITLRDTALEDKDVVLQLDDRDYTWYIRKPSEYGAVENGGFFRLVGEYTELAVGDKVTTLQPGAGENDLFIPDYGNELLMFVDLETGNFRSHKVDNLIAAQTSVNAHGNVVETTVCTVDRGGLVQVFDSSFNLLWSYESPWLPQPHPDIIGPSYNGFSVFFGLDKANSGVIRVGNFGGLEATPGLTTRNKTLNCNGTYVTLGSGQLHPVQFGYSGITINVPNMTWESVFQGDYRFGTIAIIDQTSGTLHIAYRNNYKPSVSKYVGDIGVLSSVAIGEDGVYVGFFDEGVKLFDFGGELIETVSEDGTSFMQYDDELGLVATRLHDTDIVYSVEQRTETLNHTLDVALNKSVSITFNYSAEVGATARLLNDIGTVTVDGAPFAGYLPATCVVKFTMPGHSLNYNFSKMGIVAATSYEWDVRTVPSLTALPVTLPPRYDAEIRTYEEETVEIEGITEGYFEEIYTTSSRLQIQVNGGEWSDRAQVTLKDAVVIRWYLERYGAEYDPNNHIYFERNGQLFASWYVLKMELDGVEVQRPRSEDFNRRDMVFEDDYPKLRAQAAKGRANDQFARVQAQAVKTVYNLKGYEQFEVGANLAEGNGEELFKVYAKRKSIKNLCSQDYSVNLYHKHTIKVPVFGDAEVDYQAVYGEYLLRHDVDVANKISEIDTEGNMLVSNKFFTFYSEGDISKHRKFTELSSGYEFVWNRTDRDANWSDRQAFNAVHAIGIAAGHIRGVKSIVLKIQTEWSRYVNVSVLESRAEKLVWNYSVRTFEPSTVPNSSGFEALVDIEVLSGDKAMRGTGFEFVTNGVDKGSAITREFNVNAMMSEPKYFHFGVTAGLDTTTVFRQFLLYSEAASSVKFRQFSINGSMAVAADLRTFAVEGDVAGASKNVTQNTVTDTDSAATIVEVRAKFVRLDTAIRDVEVDHGLFTEAEAEAEVLTYGDGTRVSAVKVGDSYVVNSAPEEEVSICEANDKVLKTFGYLGGG